jgi:hypothetical protein
MRNAWPSTTAAASRTLPASAAQKVEPLEAAYRESRFQGTQLAPKQELQFECHVGGPGRVLNQVEAQCAHLGRASYSVPILKEPGDARLASIRKLELGRRR